MQESRMARVSRSKISLSHGLVLFGVVALAGACGGNDAKQAVACDQPGLAEACSCSGQPNAGTQTCQDDGFWSDCDCGTVHGEGGTGTGGSDAGTGGAASGGVSAGSGGNVVGSGGVVVGSGGTGTGGAAVGSGGSGTGGAVVGSGGSGTGGDVVGSGGSGTGGDVVGSGGSGTGGDVVGSGGSGTGGDVVGSGGSGTGGDMSSGGEAGSGGDAGSAGAAGTGGNAGSGGSGGPTLPPITDYSDDGPFATTVDTNVGPGGGYTVFRPDPLGQDGFLHAPIIFGPGIGQSVTVHTTMLTNFASHGFVVVGTPVLSGGPGDAGNRASMQNGLDWIIEQNSTPGIYQNNLWVDHAVSMGFSVGGTAAVEIGGDPAVATVVSIHGHTASAALHGTMLQTTGTADTVGLPMQQQTYDMSQVPTFMATLTDAPHTYIEQNGGGEERPAIVAWMRYWIYADTGAEPYFYGDDCVLCLAPWENPQRKNWD